MRKALTTIVLTLGLLFAGAPIVAASPAEPPCATSAIGGEPAPEYVNDTCQEVVFELEAIVYALRSTVRALEFRVSEQRQVIRQKRHKIRHQRRVIRHLRAELAAS